MVSILPGGSNWDIIGQHLGENVGRALPQAVSQGYQRQQGLSAIDQLQQQLQDAGGDMTKMLPALARAYTLNPGLERSGLGQFALQQAKVQNAFGPQSQTQPQGPPNQPQSNQMAGMAAQSSGMDQQPNQAQPQTPFATPSPFNIMTVPDMEAEAKRYAGAVNDPNAYITRLNTLQAQNEAATQQRQALEKGALEANISPDELPRFMTANAHLDTRNPSEWLLKAKRNYAEVKNNDDKIQRAFIPGIGNGLLGQNREEDLERLGPALRDNAKRGLEQQDRNYLASNYVTPSEIESLYHPMEKSQEKSLQKLPKGVFPMKKAGTLKELANPFETFVKRQNPFISYEEAREKDPKALEVMQNNLADFFMKNVNDDTAILPLRDKIVEEKDYDWRQIGPSIRKAQEKGLKLNDRQEREMATIDSQAPIQSLPDVFRDLSRVPGLIRGSK